MYALVHQNQVILTQGNWNPIMFNNTLLEECGISKRLYVADEMNVPIIFNDDTKLVRYFEIKPDCNSKIEWLDGPVYQIEEFTVTGIYTKKPLDLSIAKGNLLKFVTPERYSREVKNTEILVQNQTVKMLTSRETRSILAANLLTIGEGTINWKFDDKWLQLNKEDLQSILEQIHLITQEAYDWEISKTNEINSCTTLEQIDGVKIFSVPDFFGAR